MHVTTELIVQYIRAMKNASASKVKTLHRIVDDEGGGSGVQRDAGHPLRRRAAAGSEAESGACCWRVSCGRTGRSSSPPAMMSCTSHDDVIVVTTDTQLEDLRDILAE